MPEGSQETPRKTRPRHPRAQTSVYALLREQVRHDLRNARPGDRVPPERKLAEQYGVSPITISRALQELQNEGLLSRIPGKGTFIARTEPLSPDVSQPATPVSTWDELRPALPGSQNRPAYGAPLRLPGALNADDLPAGAPELNAWIIGDLGGETDDVTRDAWPHRVASALERTVQRLGGRTVVTALENVTPGGIDAEIERAVSSGANSAIFIESDPLAHEARADYEIWMRRLLQLQIRRPHDSDEISDRSQNRTNGLAVTLVQLGDRPRQPFSSVRLEAEYGIYQATSYLVELGHRRIVCLGPAPEIYPWVRERVRGFRRAMSRIGDVPQSDAESGGDVVYAESPGPHDSPHDMVAVSASAASRFLSDPASNDVTAVIALNDYIARALIERARERGRRVPEDLSVIGFDDWAGGRAVGLTTLHPPIEELGEQAAALALHQLAHPESAERWDLVLVPTLVVRSTTGRPRPAGA